AESLLRGALADPRVPPQSQTYRDGLFNLGDLLFEDSRFADAIGRMEEFLALYRDDPERTSVRFLLADAYRRSALTLRARPPAEAPAEAVRQESAVRLRRAAQLFAEFEKTG